MTWVGGISVSLHKTEEELQPSRAVAEMEMQDAGFSPSIPPTRQSAASRAISSNVGWEERWSETAISPAPMTLSMRTRSERMLPVMVSDRDLVGAGKDKGRYPLGLERPGLGQERFQVPGDPVCSQAADDRSHAAGDDLLDPDLGRPGCRAAFTPAAQDMDVGVDEARERHIFRRRRSSSCPPRSPGPTRARRTAVIRPPATRTSLTPSGSGAKTCPFWMSVNMMSSRPSWRGAIISPGD